MFLLLQDLFQRWAGVWTFSAAGFPYCWSRNGPVASRLAGCRTVAARTLEGTRKAEVNCVQLQLDSSVLDGFGGQLHQTKYVSMA